MRAYDGPKNASYVEDEKNRTGEGGYRGLSGEARERERVVERRF